PSDDFHKLAGLENVKTTTQTTFIRPRQELPYLKPLATVTYEGEKIPCLATQESFEAGDLKVAATFTGGDAPAVVSRKVGEGIVPSAGAHLGLAYLYTAMQPPTVPDRGPQTHAVPTKFDPGVRKLLASILKGAEVRRTVDPNGSLLDARLLEA